MITGRKILMVVLAQEKETSMVTDIRSILIAILISLVIGVLVSACVRSYESVNAATKELRKFDPNNPQVRTPETEAAVKRMHEAIFGPPRKNLIDTVKEIIDFAKFTKTECRDFYTLLTSNSLINPAISTTKNKLFTVALIIVMILSLITLVLNFSWSPLIGIIFGALFLYEVYSTRGNSAETKDKEDYAKAEENYTKDESVDAEDISEINSYYGGAQAGCLRSALRVDAEDISEINSYYPRFPTYKGFHGFQPHYPERRSYKARTQNDYAKDEYGKDYAKDEKQQVE